MRKRLFEIIDGGKVSDRFSQAYDFFMMLTITISIIPLCFREDNIVFDIIDWITVTIFIADYLARLVTADYKLKLKHMSFFAYPFTPMAIIDLISILPSLTIMQEGFRLLKVFRLIRTFKVFRIFKSFRYSKDMEMIANVLKREKESLLAVFGFATGYVLIAALVIFNVEPDTFPTLFDAVYWATVSLTTVGYGDIYAVSGLGKIITMISSVLGIAIVALPAGIITSGYTAELEKTKNKGK